MTHPIISTEYRAIAGTRYLLRKVEESIEEVYSVKNFSIFNLLKQFRLTEKEREKLLEGKGFLERFRFNLIGENYQIDARLKNEIAINDVLKTLILKKISPLNPTEETKDQIHDLFIHKKYILENLRAANKCAAGISIAFTTGVCIWASYNLIQGFSDWSAYCGKKSSSPSGQYEIDQNCPTSNFFAYFWNTNKAFFAMPALILLGVVIQNIDSELISKFVFSPLDSVRRSATNILHRISNIKDFLLDKASDPGFIKPHFEKV